MLPRLTRLPRLPRLARSARLARLAGPGSPGNRADRADRANRANRAIPSQLTGVTGEDVPHPGVAPKSNRQRNEEEPGHVSQSVRLTRRVCQTFVTVTAGQVKSSRFSHEWVDDILLTMLLLLY